MNLLEFSPIQLHVLLALVCNMLKLFLLVLLWVSGFIITVTGVVFVSALIGNVIQLITGSKIIGVLTYLILSFSILLTIAIYLFTRYEDKLP